MFAETSPRDESGHVWHVSAASIPGCEPLVPGSSTHFGLLEGHEIDSALNTSKGRIARLAASGKEA